MVVSYVSRKVVEAVRILLRMGRLGTGGLSRQERSETEQAKQAGQATEKAGKWPLGGRTPIFGGATHSPFVKLLIGSQMAAQVKYRCGDELMPGNIKSRQLFRPRWNEKVPEFMRSCLDLH